MSHTTPMIFRTKQKNSKHDLQFWIPSTHESTSTSTDKLEAAQFRHFDWCYLCHCIYWTLSFLLDPVGFHIDMFPCFVLSSHSATGLPMDAQIKMPTFAVVTPLHWFIMKQNLQWQKLFPIFPKTSSKYSRYKEYNEIDKTWNQNLHAAALPLVSIQVHSQRTWWGMLWDSDKMLIILSFIRAYPKKLALLGCWPLQYLQICRAVDKGNNQERATFAFMVLWCMFWLCWIKTSRISLQRRGLLISRWYDTSPCSCCQNKVSQESIRSTSS